MHSRSNSSTIESTLSSSIRLQPPICIKRPLAKTARFPLLVFAKSFIYYYFIVLLIHTLVIIIRRLEVLLFVLFCKWPAIFLPNCKRTKPLETIRRIFYINNKFLSHSIHVSLPPRPIAEVDIRRWCHTDNCIFDEWFLRNVWQPSNVSSSDFCKFLSIIIMSLLCSGRSFRWFWFIEKNCEKLFMDFSESVESSMGSQTWRHNSLHAIVNTRNDSDGRGHWGGWSLVIWEMIFFCYFYIQFIDITSLNEASIVNSIKRAVRQPWWLITSCMGYLRRSNLVFREFH